MSRDDPKPGSDVPDRDTQDSGIPDPGIPDLGKMPELGQVLAMEAAEIEAGTAPVSGDCKDPEWFATLLDGYCTEAESREYQALLGEDAALAARFASYSKTVESFARLRAATEGEDGGPFLRSRILVALKEEAGLPAGRMAGPEQQAGERVEPGRIGPVLAFLGSVCVAAASLLLFFVLSDPRDVGELPDKTQVSESLSDSDAKGLQQEKSGRYEERLLGEEADDQRDAGAEELLKGLLAKAPSSKRPFPDTGPDPALASDLAKREALRHKRSKKITLPQLENEQRDNDSGARGVGFVQSGKPDRLKSFERVGRKQDRADKSKTLEVKSDASKTYIAVDRQLTQVPMFALSLRDVAKLAPLLRRNLDHTPNLGKLAEKTAHAEKKRKSRQLPKKGDGLRDFVSSLALDEKSEKTSTAKRGRYFRGLGDSVPPGKPSSPSASNARQPAAMRELVRLRGTESELLEILSKLRAIAGSTEVARLSREKLNGLTALHVAGGSATAGGWFSDVLADAAKPETVKDSPLRLQTSRKELSRKEQWADRAESAKEGRSAEVLEIYIILVRLQMPSQKK